MVKSSKGLDIEMAEVRKDIGYIKESQYKMDEKLDKLIEKVEKHIVEEERILDGKYANKWVEKVLIYIGTSIGGILIVAFMYLILK